VNNSIQHVFFDLDRTLWDFEKSAEQAFDHIFDKYNLGIMGVPSGKAYHDAYTIHNERLWELYRKGEIAKEVLRGKRFNLTNNQFGIVDEDLAEKIGFEYVRVSPLIVKLFPYAIGILEYLSQKDYNLHIITNGFEEVQAVKLRESQMKKYFDKVITSEEAGIKKPEKGIFDYAFKKTGASPEESIMIGDDFEVDIIGAKNVGMAQIFFDPKKLMSKPDCDFHIECLKEIEGIL
jgi:putative hydrolase of the HAD superfamily